MSATIICIEGNDCTGKETHTRLLKEKIENLGKKVEVISFPQYQNESSIFVKNYLNGMYGADASNVNPYSCSLYFILDRLVSFMTSWKRLVETNDFIILDRYVGSNLIHQGCKFHTKKEIRDYIKWECDLEYNKLKLPRPDVIYFLRMPLWASKLLHEGRSNKINGSSKQDIHENNNAYMARVEKISKIVCELESWKVIDCISQAVSPDGVGDAADILTIDTINETIFKDVKKLYIDAESDGDGEI